MTIQTAVLIETLVELGADRWAAAQRHVAPDRSGPPVVGQRAADALPGPGATGEQLDLLVLDESNPRSISFQVLGLYDFLFRLSESFGPCDAELSEPMIARLHALDVGRDLHPGAKALPAFLGELQSLSSSLSDLLTMRFFSHVAQNQRYFAR